METLFCYSLKTIYYMTIQELFDTYNNLETIWYGKLKTNDFTAWNIFDNLKNIKPCVFTTWKPYTFTHKKCNTKERSYDFYKPETIWFNKVETNSYYNPQTIWYYNNLITIWHNIFKTNDITNRKPYDMKKWKPFNITT